MKVEVGRLLKDDGNDLGENRNGAHVGGGDSNDAQCQSWIEDFGLEELVIAVEKA